MVRTSSGREFQPLNSSFHGALFHQLLAQREHNVRVDTQACIFGRRLQQSACLA